MSFEILKRKRVRLSELRIGSKFRCSKNSNCYYVIEQIYHEYSACNKTSIKFFRVKCYNKKSTRIYFTTDELVYPVFDRPHKGLHKICGIIYPVYSGLNPHLVKYSDINPSDFEDLPF